MRPFTPTLILFVTALPVVVAAQRPATNCKSVEADLVEDRATSSCRPGHESCFTGSVHGHGLRGSTYFKADGGAPGPASSPGWVSYSGQFEYQTAGGTLIAREIGVFNTTQGNPESGATSAFQQIVGGTGEFAGSSGHLFVYGFNLNNHVVTLVSGQICKP